MAEGPGSLPCPEGWHTVRVKCSSNSTSCRGPWAPQPAGGGQCKHNGAVWSGVRALGTLSMFSTSL